VVAESVGTPSAGPSRPPGPPGPVRCPPGPPGPLLPSLDALAGFLRPSGRLGSSRSATPWVWSCSSAPRTGRRTTGMETASSRRPVVHASRLQRRQPTVHPGAVEICGDGIDNDCDARSTRAAPLLHRPRRRRYFASAPGTPVDCNDGNAAIHPGATDVCGNGVDETVRRRRTMTAMAISDGDRRESGRRPAPGQPWGLRVRR
jgi:hypothetical protein